MSEPKNVRPKAHTSPDSSAAPEPGTAKNDCPQNVAPDARPLASSTPDSANEDCRTVPPPANAPDDIAGDNSLSDNGDSAIHPGLAAALKTSQAYAQRGLADSPKEPVQEQTQPGPLPSGSSPEENSTSSESSSGGPDPHSATAPLASDRDAPESSQGSAMEGAAVPSTEEFHTAAVLETSSPRSGAAGMTEASENKEPASPSESLDSPIQEGAASAGGDHREENGEKAPYADDAPDSDEEEEEEEEEEGDSPMTLRDHLNELRKRVFRAFLIALAGFAVCYPFAKEISIFLLTPLNKVKPSDLPFIYTAPAEAFFTEMKIAFVAGLFLTSPFIFYQIWAFVAPGLYKEEKHYILPVALFSAIFFVSGGAFCYFIAFPFIFDFFMSYNSEFLKAMLAISTTLNFVLQLLLAFGIIFELPLFAFFLSRLGIINADMLRRFRRYAILIMVIVAAILTPPDVISQLLMAGPLLVLYEVSILIAAIFGKKKSKGGAEDSPDETPDPDLSEDA